MPPSPFQTRADIALARRLERAEAMANAAFVDARHLLEPNVGARWTEVAGAFAMFDGVDSPLTQTFGIGIFDAFGETQFDEVEHFFAERNAPTFHEVCTFAAPETLTRLAARGYSPIEASAVLVRSTGNVPPATSDVRVRTIESHETGVWAGTSAEGWSSDSPELRDFIEALGSVTARANGVSCFLAELDGVPVAAGTLHLQNGVALLAGASTVPSARRRGAQNALLAARLAHAAEQGIDLAMVVTQPGSASQRNAERQGFRPVYSRMKWRRARDPNV